MSNVASIVPHQQDLDIISSNTFKFSIALIKTPVSPGTLHLHPN